MLSQGAIEESVLTLLCFSDQHAHLLALKLTDSRLFSNRTNQLIARTALDYINTYNQPPKAALEYLLENEFRRGEEGKLLRQTLDSLSKQTNVDAQFILEQLDTFLERQALTNSLQQALELLNEGELTQAKETIYRASSLTVQQSSGLWMKNTSEALRFFERDEQTEFFSSGIKLFDDRGIRPERKTFTFLIAAAKKGKSWWLIEVGKRALQHHQKVLHITLELSEERTARRYIQSMFSLTKDHAREMLIARFSTNEQGHTTIQYPPMERESIIMERANIQRRLEGWRSCPDWIVKEFPTSTLSTEHLSLYLDSLERQRGFKPDLVIIDYADLMKIDAASLRIDTGRLYRELRGIAVSKNFALVSASQGNRESEDAKLVGKTNVAEDWSKIGTADTVLTYSQSPEEKSRGLARLYAAAAREAEDQFLILISQNYHIGQFCLDAVPMNADLSNQLQAL